MSPIVKCVHNDSQFVQNNTQKCVENEKQLVQNDPQFVPEMNLTEIKRRPDEDETC